ncbi:hypothetical protein GCM10010424_01440 [Streptomyces lienomycini]
MHETGEVCKAQPGLKTPLPQFLAERGGLMWHGTSQTRSSARRYCTEECGTNSRTDKAIDAVSRFLLRRQGVASLVSQFRSHCPFDGGLSYALDASTRLRRCEAP